MLPVIKVYDIDYSFIIKNYLNPELWQKKWTLFVYKNFITTLCIESINCRDNRIVFRIECVDKDNEELYGSEGIFYSNNAYNLFSYYLSIDDIHMLKRTINSTIFRTMHELEDKLIKSSKGYVDILRTRKQAAESLRRIAEDFLDEERVTNSDIRDAYIDWYIDKMDTGDNLEDKYMMKHRYTMLTDIWYIFAKITNNDDLLEDIVLYNSNEDIKKVQQEYEEYKTYINSEEYIEDMKEGLEDI